MLLNVGNIIDMTDINRIAPDAVLYVWQGGMTGGKGTADVLTGKVSPSGKLPDTIAYKASDYPSDANFLLVNVAKADAMYNGLVKKGIVVRNRSNVQKCRGCLRITIGTPKENDSLLNAMKNMKL